MRFRTMLLSFLVAAQAFNLPLVTQAATLNYTPVPGHESGLMQGEAPISKVGKLKLDQGIARINGNKVDIIEGSGDGGQTLLSGVLISPNLDAKGKQAKYEALAYFQDGSALKTIADPASNEQVELTDKSLVTGKIDSINNDSIVVQTENGSQIVKLDQVAEIRSPKLYKTTLIAQADSTIEPGTPFVAQAIQTNSVPVVKPDVIIHEKVAAPPTVVATPPRRSILGPLLATLLGAAAIATAIAVPLGVCLGGGGNDNRIGDLLTYQAFLNLQRNQNIATFLPFATPFGRPFVSPFFGPIL